MKVVGGRGGERIGFETFDLFGFYMDDVFDVLQPAFDEQEWFFGNYQTKRLEHRWRNDDIGDTGFIFKTDKYKSFSGSWTLTADDIARNFHSASMPRFRQVRRPQDIFQS